MLALARDGASEGLWLRAGRQTAGRGRMTRQWQSPPGNLYASTIVRIRAGDPDPSTLAFVAGLALHDAVSAYTVAMLKWPNDLLVGGAKLSGILLERADDAVVVGFGVNLLRQPMLDRPTTSLSAHCAAAPDPGRFCEELATAFARRITEWRTGLKRILSAWEGVAHPPGSRLSADLGNGTIMEGSFIGLGPDGSLRLRLADGSERAIHAADVFLV